MARTSRHGILERFIVVSMATLVTGHLILYSIHSIGGVAPVQANIASTFANTTLVLLANRRWVWGIDGRIDLRREVIPFAVIATAGLILSTILVAVVAKLIGDGLWVNAANLTGFGLLWILRFVVIDRYIYPGNSADAN